MAEVTGNMLMIGLVIFYCFLAIVFAAERNWPKCSYWIGAAIITSSVMAMR